MCNVTAIMISLTAAMAALLAADVALGVAILSNAAEIPTLGFSAIATGAGISVAAIAWGATTAALATAFGFLSSPGCNTNQFCRPRLEDAKGDIGGATAAAAVASGAMGAVAFGGLTPRGRRRAYASRDRGYVALSALLLKMLNELKSYLQCTNQNTTWVSVLIGGSYIFIIPYSIGLGLVFAGAATVRDDGKPPK